MTPIDEPTEHEVLNQAAFEAAFVEAVAQYKRIAENDPFWVIKLQGKYLVLKKNDGDKLMEILRNAEELFVKDGWHNASISAFSGFPETIEELSALEYQDIKMAQMMGIEYGEFRERRRRKYHLSSHYQDALAKQALEIAKKQAELAALTVNYENTAMTAAQAAEKAEKLAKSTSKNPPWGGKAPSLF